MRPPGHAGALLRYAGFDDAGAIALVAGPPVAPSLYRCPQCHTLERHPARLPTGGVACQRCDGTITSADATRLAGIGSRLLSAAIDLGLLWFLILPVLIALFIAIGNAPREEDTSQVTRTAAIYITLVLATFIASLSIIYLTWGNINGRSVGKRAMGLRLACSDSGGRPGVRRAVLRTLGQLITLATLGLGYTIALFDSRHRTLHDRAAGTIVIES